MNLSEGQVVSYILGMLVCVLLSAFFSATETAFSTFNRTRLKTMAEDGNKRAKLAVKLASDYDRLISTILIGNNIVNIAVASLGTVLFVSFYGDIGATISTIVITAVVLIFGEISPKSIAKDFPEKFSMFAAPLIQLLIWILLPLNFLFSMWKKFLSIFFKPKNDDKMSQAELLMLVEEVQEGGSIDTNEGNLLRNAIEFTDLKAEEILTHRVDLEALPITATKKEVASLFATSKFSRLLVYKEDIDDIVGVLHLKDFYTVDGIRYEFAKSGAKTNLVLHENSGNVCIATFIDPDSDEEGCGGCGSLGFTNNKNGTTKPPCIITVDVNGERKPTPGNVNCMDSNCAKKENVYKTPGPNEKNLRDIFSIMVTEDKAIPFGVVAQKVMYNARN